MPPTPPPSLDELSEGLANLGINVADKHPREERAPYDKYKWQATLRSRACKAMGISTTQLTIHEITAIEDAPVHSIYTGERRNYQRRCAREAMSPQSPPNPRQSYRQGRYGRERSRPSDEGIDDPEFIDLGGASLWCQPDAIIMGIRGGLDGQLHVSEEATALVAAAMDSWDYDTIALQTATGGHALRVVADALLEYHGLYSACNIDRETARRFFAVAEAAYGTNAYHDSVHAADVGLGVHVFITKYGLHTRLSHLDIFALLVGAIMHDFNHPGTTNTHEVKAATRRCIAHGTVSVLERHHLQSAFMLLDHASFDLFSGLSPDDRIAVRLLIVDLVLATDLSRHVDSIETLRTLAATRGATAHRQAHSSSADAPDAPWFSSFHDKSVVGPRLLLSVAIKFADLGHATKTSAIHQVWTERITQELWALGDRERMIGMAVSPLCDRKKDTDIPKSQVAFFNFICVPFYTVVADLVEPEMTPWLHVQHNLNEWRNRLHEHEASAEGSSS